MKTLLTGGAGYIGSHTAIELISHGHEVVIFDNFSNSHPEAIRRVEQITGRTIAVINGDVRDQAALEQALQEHGIDSVVHFAGKKAVGESVAQPVDYYDNNVNGTLVLLRAMKKHNVRKLVFSSSATVYGSPQYLPLNEVAPYFGHQSLWPQPTDGGRDSVRPLPLRLPMVAGRAALLQSHWCPCQRPDW
jgi:UDP-glucose 4-epimerase